MPVVSAQLPQCPPPASRSTQPILVNISTQIFISDWTNIPVGNMWASLKQQLSKLHIKNIKGNVLIISFKGLTQLGMYKSFAGLTGGRCDDILVTPPPPPTLVFSSIMSRMFLPHYLIVWECQCIASRPVDNRGDMAGWSRTCVQGCSGSAHTINLSLP